MIEDRKLGPRYDKGHSPLGAIPKLPDLATALRHGSPNDMLIMPGGSISTVEIATNILRQEAGLSIIEYDKLPWNEQNRIFRMIERKARKLAAKTQDQLEKYGKAAREENSRRERTELHRKLHTWAAGTLTMERPQASSLHHLINYDKQCGSTSSSFLDYSDDMQNIVVEHEWARALPPTMLGEWRLPFEQCCWEFRISGVRVLAFTFADDVENPKLVMVYGKDHTWVSDDYIYYLGGDGLVGRAHEDLIRGGGNVVEFRRVAELVRANIRAACIMLEASTVVERVTREPGEGLIAKAKREGTSPPKRHQIIQLINMERRAAYRDRYYGGTSGNKQGGHWRRGTWVHFDDQDSGKVQYVNDGGFVLSKTWRGWHFAGDPTRMVDKEYRL